MKTNNWRKYNNMEVHLNKFRKQDELRIKALQQHDKELKQMNKRKRGRPYKYAHTLLLYLYLLQTIHQFSLRDTIAYVIYHKLLDITPNFRTLSYRLPSIPLHKYQEEILAYIKNHRFIAISIDATGFSKNQINVWFEEKHKVKKKRSWMKVELIVDTATKKVIYHNIYEGNKVNEASHKRFKKTINTLIKKGYKVRVLYADALYDSYNNFQFLENKGILPIIKIRKRSVISLHNQYEGYVRNGKETYARRLKHLARDYYALEQYYWERYKSRYRYGNRELAESVVSVIKQKYGRNIRYRKDENIRKALELKIYAYNLFS